MSLLYLSYHYYIITSKRYLFIKSMITDRIGRQEVLFPIEHKNYNFRERENNQVKLSSVMIGWFKLYIWMWLVNLHNKFECDCLVELSDNKLSDNNLASELVENRSFFKPITIKEFVIFIINIRRQGKRAVRLPFEV